MAYDRDAAWRLVTEWTQSDGLRRHMLAVEAAMRFYAGLYGEDEEVWAVTGLLHDFDYERNPTPPHHPTVGMSLLAEEGWPQGVIDAIAGHADYLAVPRETRMAKALFAVDELCGFITAVAYTRPSRSLADVEPASVLKKLRQPAFARAVSREDITSGAEELGVPLEQHVANCIAAMRTVAPTLGL